MPIFEYKCTECGEKFDELDSVANRDKPHKCPACGSMKSERQLSVFSAGSDAGGFGGGGCAPSGSG
jgi:putative FmdB family regulatory protein